MSTAPWWRTVPVILLLAAGGCGSPALIQVDTFIHGDGSCDRAIWQPRDEMLPEDALKPAWNARWKSISLVAIPPEVAKQAGNGPPSDEHHYFSARGIFRSPAEIPAHFRRTLDEARNAGASELVRSYDCVDYGFVREHRWRETLTNIVTHDKFLKARDEFVNLALPLAIQGIEQVYGESFDVTGLTQNLRKEGRRFAEQAALAFYDTAARHMTDDEQSRLYAELVRGFGLDLFDAAGSPVAGEEFRMRIKTFFRHRIALGMRHRDGSRLTETEIQAVLDLGNNSPFSQAWSTYWTRHEAQFKEQLLPLIYQMMGLYNALLGSSQNPLFAFDLHLPGEVVSTSGTIEGPDHVRWRFTGDRSFPDGFVMQARSIEIKIQEQKRILGRVAIDDKEQAESYIELLDQDGRLLEAVRRVHASGDLKPLLDDPSGSAEERARWNRLRLVLGVATERRAP